MRKNIAAAGLLLLFAALLAWMATKLESSVKEVRLSTRLTTSPACLVVDTNDITPALAKMYRAMGQNLPLAKRILELNPTHPLVTGLRQAHEDRPEDEGLAETVELLLPEEPTVSRVHAKFAFRDGQWRVTGLGRNGLMVNEMPVRGEQVVRDGDLIRWGDQPGALASRVQIGPA